MRNDWEIFATAVLQWLQGQDPYASGIYGSPPWTLPVLVPFAWLPWWLGMLLPALALLYLARRQRKAYLIPIVGLSFPFVACSVYGNIDWLPMIGVVIGGWLGAILNTTKPQAAIGAVAAELAKRETWQARVMMLLPLAILAVLFLPMLMTWLEGMFGVGRLGSTDARNFTLFPYSLPVGLLAAWFTVRRKSPAWGCVASLCVSPYFYIHSTLPLLFLVADQNWRYGVLMAGLSWVIVAAILIGLIPIAL